jgi:hypothetical protein
MPRCESAVPSGAARGPLEAGILPLIRWVGIGQFHQPDACASRNIDAISITATIAFTRRVLFRACAVCSGVPDESDRRGVLGLVIPVALVLLRRGRRLPGTAC